MTDKRIPHELGRLIKEKGFDWPCDRSIIHYFQDNVHIEDGKTGPFGWQKDEMVTSCGYFINNLKNCDYSNEDYNQFALPTLSALQNWFRDAHNIDCESMRCLYSGEPQYSYIVLRDAHQVKHSGDVTYPTYEKALEAGLLESLKLIK